MSAPLSRTSPPTDLLGDPMPAPLRVRSKTLATWLALLGGSLGAHRFYLHGKCDLWAWLHPWPTLLGLVGVLRMRALGQDDTVAWLLIPVLGLMISQAMLAAILIGLTPDERWRARFATSRPSGWGAVLGVIAALMIGGVVFMGTLAFGGQKFFEWQAGRSAHPQATIEPARPPLRTASD